MKNAMKGILLSGLVLPGLGQVYLKSYKRGIVLILIVVAAFCVIVASSVSLAQTVLEKVASEGGPIDMESMTNAASQAVVNTHTLSSNLAFIMIFICWLVGMVDAYMTGQKIDRGERL